ncbi:DUF4349 domain-containing protein [Streptomyces sp. NPDC090108]|uniref:DUF4349 domain-containing protein n=1 Tax=Streptomyces sp. NPDC090108 TaxID=3365947 RepID=UPI00380BC519
MRAPRSTRSVRALAGVLLAASLALAGCGAPGGSGGSSGDSGKSAAGRSDQRAGAGGGADRRAGGGAEGAASTAGTPRPAPDAVIRTASLTVQVADVQKALADARTAVEGAGGYVGEESTGRDPDGHERTRVVLRVPAAKYEEVMSGLQGAGRLVERTARAQDVTDEVVDVDSRVRSQRASVARVRELMGRAEKLSDVVALEGELGRREADLEALLARQASLKDRVDLATITLSLSAKPARTHAADGTPGFLDALSGGWHVFVAMLRWFALALGAALPFAVSAGVLVWLWLRVVRPRLPRRPDPAPAPGAPLAPAPLPQAPPVPGPDRT